MEVIFLPVLFLIAMFIAWVSSSIESKKMYRELRFETVVNKQGVALVINLERIDYVIDDTVIVNGISICLNKESARHLHGKL